MIRTISFLLVAVMAAPAADEVDRIVAREMERQHIPGVSVGVMRDGRLIKAGGYGVSNLELSAPATVDSVYAIGSVSKQFIAACVLILAQEGRLSIDDPLGKFMEDAPSAWRPITLRRLLTHTSGLVREAPGFQPTRPQSDLEVIRSAYPLPLANPIGAKWEYSNLGYFILGDVVRRVSGKPWADFLEERILRPLEMHTTRTTTQSEIIPLRASSYMWNSGKYTNAPVLLTVRPSGALLSTVIDMAKWDAALYTEQPLTAESKRRAVTAVKLIDGTAYPYGLGWRLDPVRGHRAMSHGGTLQGFKSHFLRLPDDHLSVIVFTNVFQAEPGPIAEQIALVYLPR